MTENLPCFGTFKHFFKILSSIFSNLCAYFLSKEPNNTAAMERILNIVMVNNIRIRYINKSYALYSMLYNSMKRERFEYTNLPNVRACMHPFLLM